LSIRPSTLLALCAIVVALAGPRAADGQSPTCQFRGTPGALAERPSPLDSVALSLGGDVAKLCYGRPGTGGQVMIGGALPLGSPWEMGANEPTTLHLPFAARVGTVELAAGSYSLYAIPETDRWTIVVNGNPDRWGVPLSAEVRAADIGSFTVTPEVGAEHVDRLTFAYRPTGERTGSLVFSWERVTLSIPVARP